MIIDLDKKRSADQQELVKQYYKGYIPHVVVLDGSSHAAYNESGEISEAEISLILDGLLSRPAK